MHAFWPLVGQLRASTPAMVQVICSVHGTMELPLDDAPSKSDSLCAMCSAAGTALASVFLDRTTSPVAPRDRQVVQDLSAPSQRALHSLPSPRAPPQAS
jgi:hypothetical protein